MDEEEFVAPGQHVLVTASATAGGCPPVVSPSVASSSGYGVVATGSVNGTKPQDENFITNITSDAENEESSPHSWYVMRSSYSREMKAKALLERDGFVCYVPMRKERVERNGVVRTQMVPAVHNLLFVRTSRLKMDPWKLLHEGDAALRYMMDKSTKHPMVVSDKSMQDFMQVTSQSNDDILYLDNPEVVVERGQKVEIIVGPFKGVQGYVLRIRRDRRVVVSLQGLVAVAMASMPQSHFRLLSQSRGLTP